MTNKNIILQHYNGTLSELAKLSIANMQRYAEQCKADYRLVVGEPVEAIRKIKNKNQLKKVNACHKLHMLNKEFDSYDTVVMVDPDMFVRKDLQRNIFKDETGIGICSDHIRNNAAKRFRLSYPQFSSNYAFWGGAIWRLDRQVRQALRSNMNYMTTQNIGSTIFVDEGIMHNLATMAKIPDIPRNVLSQKWCWCSYLPNQEDAYMIHMRKKDSNGDKTTKDESYQHLKNLGIVSSERMNSL